MTEFFVLIGLVALRVALVLAGAALLLRHRPACPACFRESVPVRWPGPAARLPWIERRWCPACGWQGISRRAPLRHGTAVAPSGEGQPRNVQEVP